MNNIAIITARGGSKRIPRKNIKEFCGKPIIAYSIIAAIESKCFSEIMVSTDDEEIASISQKYGAKVPFYRGTANSGDFATTADVIDEVLGKYLAMGQKYDNFCCIYPTAPLLDAKTIQEAYQLLLDSGCDSVIPVTPFTFPPQRAFHIVKGFVRYKCPENMNTRSQDLDELYHDAGQFYFMKTTAFLKEKSLVTKNTLPYKLKPTQVQDIDNQEDWALAELKYQLLQKSK